MLGKNLTAKLEVKESADKGVYVKDLTKFVVKSAADMDKIMTKGNSNRQVQITTMNLIEGW